MKEVKIKIYGWSDFKKWLWDRFFFPRRRVVTEWLESYGDALRHSTEAILLKYSIMDLTANNFEGLNKVLQDWDLDRVKIEERIKELIMEK